MVIQSDRLREIFKNIRDLPVAVIGDVMLDRYIWGNVERISPEAPVPVVYVERESARLGGAANVAWNLRAIGSEPVLFGIIGDDFFGKQFHELIREYDISTDYLVTDPDRPTTSKARIIARGQQMLRIDRENTVDIHREIGQELADRILSSLDDIAGLVISDYGKGTISKNLLEKIVPIARRHGKFIVVDPKERHFKLYHRVSLVTPNSKEAGDAVGIHIKDEADLLEAGTKLLELTGAENILITKGSDGMSLFSDDDRVEHFPTMARQVYDVTGAGDTVAGVFTAVVSAGGTLREAAIISSHAAGVVVGKVGTAVASPEEIQESIELERKKKDKM